MTARTIFQDRKRLIRDYLLAIAIFVNGVKGHSALQLSRDLDCQYKTAFIIAHKLREAMGSEAHSPDQPELSETECPETAAPILRSKIWTKIQRE